MAKKIAGVGAANVDLHGQSRAALILRDSNPGHLHCSAGGVTRNILDNLTRLDHETELCSAVGSDVFGDYLRADCERLGIGTAQLLRVPGAASSAYLAVLDERGDMYIGMSDMGILSHITPDYLADRLDWLRGCAAVVCDPCLPAETLEYLSSGVLDGVPLYADPVSTAYAGRLAPFAGGFTCLKPNLMELGVLSGTEVTDDASLERACGLLLERGTERVVVSMGERGCYWADRRGNRFFRALRPVKHMTDATGAGDAFMAGLIHADICALAPEQAAETALAAGIAAVTSAGTVSPGMCTALIGKILEDNQ